MKIAALVAGILLLTVYLANASWLADPLEGRPFLVAHRGLAQSFDKQGLTGKTCTAARMVPTGHDHLENTIPSMQTAFDLGADAVEFDVHQTKDGRFAVFHDWTLDCRTDGSGVTREHTLEELQRLDVGYGYTADGGETFPFRGRGVGMMPSLEQVLAAFPDRNFLIDVKSDDPLEGELLTERLRELLPGRTGETWVFGGPRPVGVVYYAGLPGVRTLTRPRLKNCLKRYLAFGWSGHVPPRCKGTVLFVPANVAPWLWGWPNRFLQRMHAVDTPVVLIGDYAGEKFSNGFDDPERLNELPDDYAGGIWTDRIDLFGPALSER